MAADLCRRNAILFQLREAKNERDRTISEIEATRTMISKTFRLP